MPKAERSTLRRRRPRSNMFSSIIEKYESLDGDCEDAVINSEGKKIFKGTHKEVNKLTRLDKDKLKKIYDTLNNSEKKSPSAQTKVKKDQEQYAKSLMNVSISFSDISEIEKSVDSNSKENVELKKQNGKVCKCKDGSLSSGGTVDSLLDSVLDETFGI